MLDNEPLTPKYPSQIYPTKSKQLVDRPPAEAYLTPEEIEKEILKWLEELTEWWQYADFIPLGALENKAHEFYLKFLNLFKASLPELPLLTDADYKKPENLYHHHITFIGRL